MAGNTVTSVKTQGGSGVNTILNTNPDVTAYTIVQVGHVPSSSDLPSAADYPGCMLNVGSDLTSLDGVYWSDGSQWLQIADRTWVDNNYTSA